MKVEIDGHQVDEDKVDLFYNGSDGSRVTDAQWDESRERLETDPQDINLEDLGFEYIGTEPPEEI